MDISYYKKYEPIDGKWYITKELGSGAFGKVFEIERKDFSNAKSALKVITIPSSQSEVSSYREENYDLDEQSISSYFYGFVVEFTKEFELMLQLKGNSNIVSIEDFDVKQHNDGVGWDLFIRMELLTPMNKYFKEHSPNQNDVIRLGIDICKALEVCQKYNIVHRDIKPSNIFVSQTGEYKLGDFGVARTLEKTSGALSKKGTYTYMAPEVYQGGEYGSNVDIYSLGIVMYKLLNGNKEPFKSGRTFEDEEKALVLRMKGEPLPKPENAEGRLAEIVLKACSYNPKDRYESPLQLRAELESILNEQIVQSIPVDEDNDEDTLIPDNRYINGIYYKWDDSVMDVDKITEFSVSYGDCPIVNVRYSNKKLTVFNRINGSRDGWMNFPEGYFDEKYIELSENEDSKIKECLKELSFEKWTTSDHILKNHLNMATGFCVHNSFRCSLENGEIFECLEPETKEFKKLIRNLEGFISKESKETYNEETDKEKTIGVFGNDKKPSKDEKKTLEETNKADEHPSKSYIKWIAIFAIFVVALTVIVALLYNSSKDKITENRIQLSDINVLDVVSIGSYEQDNNIENGNERIEWVVLDKSEDEVLLVSKNILDVQQYNGVPGEVTWENSSLKKWLNREFYNYAFSNDEQSIVIQNNNENVTLLNIDEVREYQGIIDSNLDEFTVFSYDKTYNIKSRPDNEGFIAPYGEMMHKQVYSGWWVKSSNPLDYAMTYGFFDDEIMENSGMKVTANFIGVRPVIRIKNALKTEDGQVLLENWIKSKDGTNEYLKNKKTKIDNTNSSYYTISEYDEKGLETKITTYDENNTMSYYAIVEYDSTNNMIKWLDYDENNIKYSETEFIYNEDGRLIKEIIFDENGQQAATIEYTYEGCNRIQTWIDKDGNVDKESGFIEELDINGNRVKSFSYENGEVDEFTKFFYGQYGEYVGSENYNSDWLLEDKETCTIID